MEDQETHRAARRTGLIFVCIIVFGLVLIAAWMIPEALRIRRMRDQRLAEQRAGSEMTLVRSSAGFRGFTMGANDGAEDEKPLHDVKLSDFWMALCGGDGIPEHGGETTLGGIRRSPCARDATAGVMVLPSRTGCYG
jgi:hypothetical protein